jgi:hypothetical protein
MKKNKAVKNNPDKFPEGYILKLDDQEVAEMRSKISTASWGGRRNAPTAFTKLKMERNNINTQTNSKQYK